jgi:DNA-directed RNA polymerase specialized sigma24 family protein
MHFTKPDMTREHYGEAYQQGFEKTVRFLLSRGASWERARETAQAAWARGWERLEQLRDDERVGTWVNTIALNAYRGLLRSEQAHQAQPELATAPGVKVAEIDLAVIDMARILKVCRPCDRVLLEQQIHGLTPEDIARKQGVTKTAVRIRFMRARQAARTRIEQRARRMRLGHISLSRSAPLLVEHGSFGASL